MRFSHTHTPRQPVSVAPPKLRAFAVKLSESVALCRDLYRLFRSVHCVKIEVCEGRLGACRPAQFTAVASLPATRSRATATAMTIVSGRYQSAAGTAMLEHQFGVDNLIYNSISSSSGRLPGRQRLPEQFILAAEHCVDRGALHTKLCEKGRRKIWICEQRQLQLSPAQHTNANDVICTMVVKASAPPSRKDGARDFERFVVVRNLVLARQRLVCAETGPDPRRVNLKVCLAPVVARALRREAHIRQIDVRLAASQARPHHVCTSSFGPSPSSDFHGFCWIAISRAIWRLHLPKSAPLSEQLVVSRKTWRTCRFRTRLECLLQGHPCCRSAR